jgi:hypothetical protein
MNTRIQRILFFVFISFATLFPTARLLSIGSRGSVSIAEYLISAMPDLFAGLIMLLTFLFILKNKKQLQLKVFDWVFLAFIFTNVLIGFIMAGDLKISLYGFRMTYYPMFFYFILRFTDPEAIQKMMRGIFYWFLLVGAAGVVLYFLFFGVMEYMIQLSQEARPAPTYFIVRMTSVFWSPVVFSTFMAVSMMYFYYRFLTKGRWYYMLIMALLVFCVIMAMSRGTVISLLLGFILLSALGKDWKKALITLAMIVIVFLFTAYYIATPGEVFFWMAQSTADTIGLKPGITRVDLWMNAIENFREHPLGFGLGKAGHVAVRFYDENSPNVDIYTTDGWFVKTMNETGIFGILSYLSVAVFYFITFLRSGAVRRKDLTILLFFSIFVMINIQSIVSNVIDFYLFSFLFWTMTGASVLLMVRQARS